MQDRSTRAARCFTAALALVGAWLGFVPASNSRTSAAVAGSEEAASGAPLVYAAASLTDVLQQIGADYQRETGRRVRFSFASTAVLARQIEAGAAVDLFVSADEDWMNYLAQRYLIRRDSRAALLGNLLVLVAPADSRAQVRLTPGVRLDAALGERGRLALADPASVPAGRYAQAALMQLGAWAALESRVVIAENVRMALMYVARGEAPLGVVYATDARAEPRVRIVAQFPAATHPPIVYPVALTPRAGAEAKAFLRYLRAKSASARFEAAGFSVLAQ
jgi:molybdate transport system substrate-binding protein